MDGMGFLLNSMGIDPDQIKDAAGKVQATAAAFEAKLNSIELKLDLILSHLHITVQESAEKSGVYLNGGSYTEH